MKKHQSISKDLRWDGLQFKPTNQIWLIKYDNQWEFNRPIMIFIYIDTEAQIRVVISKKKKNYLQIFEISTIFTDKYNFLNQNFLDCPWI